MANKPWLLLCLFLLLGNGDKRAIQPVHAKHQQSNQSSQVKSEQKSAKRKPKPSKKQRSFLEKVLNIFKPLKQEPPLGSRGYLCLVTPGLLGKTYEIWSDRPVFIWWGKAKKIQLINDETDEILWQQSLVQTQQKLAYTGADLKPGKTYRWRLEDHSTKKEFTFVIMGTASRNQIYADLQEIVSQAQINTLSADQDNFSPDIDRALQQAQYFSDRRLWSDAITTLHTIQDASVDLTLKTAINEVVAERCRTPEYVRQTAK